MRFVLNVIWLLLCGIWMAIGYAVAGVICCILIVTIPFGIASFRIAAYALWPFGRTVIRQPTAGFWSGLGNVIWLVVAGIWLAIGHVITGALMCLTIIGIPLGIASFKMVPISLLPLGRQIVDIDEVGLVR
ncbi:YccF domain-containing protein [Nocardioides sp. SR21]|uniref:YccF domain-containing protein n=1 Tax=Nocardioides sp. SR21 TaxID=2919501 RepID=UPI001FAA57AD|nr:YccF domain-containing protein [Nocardioides sp. SR21]